jgi:hypothetical protein
MLDVTKREKLARKKRIKYDDPAHGWLKASLKDVEALGIADKISGCSFQRGNFVYLEEDCDCTTFFLAIAGVENWEAAKDDPEAERLIELLRENTTTQTTDRSSKIRSYSNYEYVSEEEKPQLEAIREAMMNLKFWGKKAKNTIKNAGKTDLLFWKKEYNL